MTAGRLTLCTTAGPDMWTAEVDPLTIHVSRQGDDIAILMDWTKPTDQGLRRGTLVVRLRAAGAVPLTRQLIHHTAPEAARRA